MNGLSAATVERWLEKIRQRALTKRLGQVTCSNPYHEVAVDIHGSCRECGAAL